MENSVEVTNLEFRSLRRVRIFPDSKNEETEINEKIAVSSQYGIMIIAKDSSVLLSSRTENVHELKASKHDRYVEVTDMKMKENFIILTPNGNLMALASNSGGQILSAFVNTNSGPFAFTFDFCLFSPDCPSQVPFIHALRLAKDSHASYLAQEWNPAEDSFAASTSDGTLSVLSVDIMKPNVFQIIGTTVLQHPVLCITWSPKGKQLIVGDSSGVVLQLKPDLTPVRSISPPEDITSFGTSVKCVGVCWLTTTDFLFAYITENQDDVLLYVLSAKKNLPPLWSFLDGAFFCSDESPFEQRIKFIPILPWNIIVCASMRSYEISVIGKHDDKWKLWILDDSARIDLPFDKSNLESFPVGIAIDFSPQIPVFFGNSKEFEGLFPILHVVSSHGLLLPSHVIYAKKDCQVLNKMPNELPSDILALVKTKDQEVPKNKVSSEVFEKPVSVEKPQSYISSPSVSFLTSSPISTSVDSSVYSLPISIPKPSVSVPKSPIPMEKKKEDGFALKLEELNQQFSNLKQNVAEMQERNNWIEDLHCTMKKVVDDFLSNSELKADDLTEVKEYQSKMLSYFDNVEVEVRESLCNINEKIRFLRLSGKENLPSMSPSVSSFNKSCQIKSMEEEFLALKDQFNKIDEFISEQPLKLESAKKKQADVFTAEDEQKIVSTSRNICKKIAAKRKELIILQQEVSDLAARVDYLSLKQNTENTKIPLNKKENRSYNPGQMLSTDTKPLKKVCVPRKVMSLALLPNKKAEKNLSSFDISGLEAHLLQTTISSLHSRRKTLIDVGTQSANLFASVSRETTASCTQTPEVSTESLPSFSFSTNTAVGETKNIGNSNVDTGRKIHFSVEPHRVSTNNELKSIGPVLINAQTIETEKPIHISETVTIKSEFDQSSTELFMRGSKENADVSSSDQFVKAEVVNVEALEDGKTVSKLTEVEDKISFLNQKQQNDPSAPHSPLSITGEENEVDPPVLKIDETVRTEKNKATQEASINFSFSMTSAQSAEQPNDRIICEANNDIGMMDEDDTSQAKMFSFSTGTSEPSLNAPKNAFSSGSMLNSLSLGFESNKSNLFGTNTTSNPFAVKTGSVFGGQPTTSVFNSGQARSSASSVFSGGQGLFSSSVFGSNRSGGSVFGTGSALFSGQQQGKSAFSGVNTSNAGGQASNSPFGSAFSTGMSNMGTAPTGSGSVFGGSAVFSKTSPFGSANQSSSFGQSAVFGQSTSQGSGFSAFSKSSSGFAALASTPKNSFSSIPQSNTSFGSSTPQNLSSSFSTWR